MTEPRLYDVAVIGGGLAGLALAIQCSKAGYKTVLFEKEKYPFHKVCGEYISLESWDFLERLGVPLAKMNLPIIKRLLVTAPNGRQIEHTLPLGGFGISRYRLDSMLAEIAKKNGVALCEESRVTDVVFEDEKFSIQGPAFHIQCRIAAGTFGKRSNLDIRWKRGFATQKPGKLNNYVGVKYHVKLKWPGNTIALHNFQNGYCGVSQIEGDRCCLCYLTTAKNLARCGNSIPQLEKVVLSRNPHLREIFESAENLYAAPLTISQVSFAKKSQVLDHILMIGDAAGMITPLCGNGMSMALHGSQIAFEQIHRFLINEISRAKLERSYTDLWKKQFGKRLQTGRVIQRFFGSTVLSNLLIMLLKPFPLLTRRLIRRTHGQSF